jgi:hypothetical protein
MHTVCITITYFTKYKYTKVLGTLGALPQFMLYLRERKQKKKTIPSISFNSVIRTWTPLVVEEVSDFVATS